MVKMDLLQDSTAIALNANFRNLDMTGLSKAKVYNVSGFSRDAEQEKLAISFKTPLASFTGPYKVRGRILILPINGEGIIKLNFSENKFYSKLNHKLNQTFYRKFRRSNEFSNEESRKGWKSLHAS